jgi:hypothetical protein
VPGDEWNQSQGLPDYVLTSDEEDDASDDAADLDFDDAIAEAPEQHGQQRKPFGWLWPR